MCIPNTDPPSLPHTMLREGIVYHHEEDDAPYCIVRRRRTPHLALQEDGEVDRLLCAPSYQRGGSHMLDDAAKREEDAADTVRIRATQQ